MPSVSVSFSLSLSPSLTHYFFLSFFFSFVACFSLSLREERSTDFFFFLCQDEGESRERRERSECARSCAHVQRMLPSQHATERVGACKRVRVDNGKLNRRVRLAERADEWKKFNYLVRISESSDLAENQYACLLIWPRLCEMEILIELFYPFLSSLYQRSSVQQASKSENEREGH